MRVAIVNESLREFDSVRHTESAKAQNRAPSAVRVGIVKGLSQSIRRTRSRITEHIVNLPPNRGVLRIRQTEEIFPGSIEVCSGCLGENPVLLGNPPTELNHLEFLL